MELFDELAFLLEHGAAPLSLEDRARVFEQLRVGFDHAISCGAVLSYITVSSAAEQQAMLDKLYAFRRNGKRWTELAGRFSQAADNRV